MGYSLRRKGPRYGPKNRQLCSGGCRPQGPRWHDSVEEAMYCDRLLGYQKVGEIRSYRSQVTYYLYDKDHNACGWMRVDFEIIKADGTKVIHEYKGKLFATLPEYKTKKALFTWNYPDIPHITVRKGEIIL